nr:ATP-dependent DNA helicase PIF1-like [Tanacetum cinerariifolium]
MWYEERSNKSKRAVNPTFFICCQEGKVHLFKFYDAPPPLNMLHEYTDPATFKFKDKIRVYNSMFCFTSFGARIDHSINTDRATYTFKINGQNYHRFGLYFQNKAFNLGKRTKSRQYNKPTVVEVAALISNDFGDCVPTRDVIIDSKDSGPKRILELHPSYMALQYPLLFPYGEDRYHEKIPYHTNEGSRKTNRGSVTMKEYYAYIIQQQNDQGTTLLRGGRLFQQYLVDAFTAVEEQRLKWSRNNQDTMRADLYHNVCDAVTRGDINAKGLDKRIVLAGTFTEEHSKCSTPAQIDDIISADILSQAEDPKGYKVVTEFMLHSPCGKDAKPLKLWNENWEAMSKDILHKKRKLFKYPELELINEQIQNYRIMEIKELLDRHGQDFLYFPDLPKPNPKLARRNRKNIFYKTIMARLRSERMIGLAVASSGIVSLLFPGGRMAHRRFVIPLELMKNNTCGIKQNAYLAKLMQQYDDDYLKERAILNPRKDDADAINAYMFKKLAGDTVTYNSADEICKASTYTLEQHNLYPIEFLKNLNFPGMPPHSLCLKKELPIMLIRNVNPSKGLCNETRLVIIELGQFVIWAKILTGSHVGDHVLIHRIILTSTQSKWLFVQNRRQFSIRPCYTMTINKSQGQLLNHVGLYLPNHVFSHDQLYVTLSRVTDPQGLKILMIPDETKELHNHTRNIVFKETFNNLN